jgi:predicted site-specific integrase-resolvase
MPIPIKNDQMLTIKEAAEYLCYSEHTIRTYLQRGLLKKAGKFGMSAVILKSECDRFSKEKRAPGRPIENF